MAIPTADARLPSISASVRGRTTLAGVPRIMEPAGASILPVTSAPRAHDAVIANLRAVEYGSTHADEHVVAHGAAVDDGAVADGAAGTHCCLLMHHRAVLNVGVFPHSDSALVAPENGVVPHADVVPQRHIAYNGSAGQTRTLLSKFGLEIMGFSFFLCSIQRE